MCYNPLTIKNNSKSGHKNVILTRTVPCGCCYECYSKYQDEWFLRAYYQFKETIAKGGCVPFLTLTYSDKFIPKFQDYHYEYIFVNGKRQRKKVVDYETVCFCKWDIQRFIKYMRRYFVSQKGWTKEEANDIKSIFCSEFGSDPTRTHRPHYHGLLFLPKQVDRIELDKMVRACWSVCRAKDKGKRFDKQKRYPIGIHSWSTKGVYVNDIKAIKYVMKYTSKDMNGYTDWHGLQEYIDADPKNFDKIKDYLPFHLQSRGFGLSGVNYISDVDLALGYVQDPTNDNIQEPHTLPLPEYYKSKIFFEKGKLESNYKLGYRVHTKRFYDTLYKRISLNLEASHNMYKSLVDNCDFFKATFANGDSIQDLDQTYDTVSKILHGRTYAYACYKKLQNFNSHGVDANDPCYLLYEFTKLSAEEHDNLVNTVDLSDIKREVEYEPYTIKKIQLVPEHDAFMYYEEDPEAIFGVKNINPNPFDSPYSYINSINEVDVPRQRRIVKEVLDDKGRPVVTPKKFTYVNDVRPSLHREIAESKAWHKFDIFKDFDTVDLLLDELRMCCKEKTSVGNHLNYVKQKAAKDYYNRLIYNNY